MTENIRKSVKKQIEEKVANVPHILSNIKVTPDMYPNISELSSLHQFPPRVFPNSTFSNESATTYPSSSLEKNQTSNNLENLNSSQNSQHNITISPATFSGSSTLHNTNTNKHNKQTNNNTNTVRLNQ